MLRTENGSWGTEEATLHFRYFRHDNTEKRPVLVFLHDALGSIAQWRDFPQLLAERTGLDALLYERRGHGRSAALTGERKPDYLQYQSNRTLPHLLRSFAIENPILIGHSDGAAIALLHAAAHPVRMVIAIAAHVLVEPITLEGIRHAVAHKEEIVSRLHKYHGDKTVALFDAWADTWLGAGFQNWDILEELKKIRRPVLAIQGTEDEYATEAQFITLSKILGKKASTLWIEHTGHFPHITHRETLAGIITDYIRSRLE
jgi:pimeloyl-ACP methyl ester carboxylesterase